MYVASVWKTKSIQLLPAGTDFILNVYSVGFRRHNVVLCATAKHRYLCRK